MMMFPILFTAGWGTRFWGVPALIPKVSRTARERKREARAGPTLEVMRFLTPFLFLLSFLSAAAQTSPFMVLHDLKEAETLGADLYTNSNATGLVLVVVRGKQMYFHSYGEAVPGSNRAPSLDSEVRLCSLTKIFTTDLLAKFVADGKVRLDEPLKKFAPNGAVVPEKDGAITLEDLATHTAGLEREIGAAPRHTPHFTYPNYDTRWNWLASAQLKFTPGTQAYYSNVGFDLLSDALSAASRMPYATLLQKRTLVPLGMWETTFFPTPKQCEKLMTGAHGEGPCTITEDTEGSSGLYSTPADMERFLKYLVGSSGTGQAEGARRVYLLPSSLHGQYGLDHAGRPSGIGLGWMHLGGSDDVDHVIEKTGGGAGFTTYIAIHPASHTALFVAMTEGSWRDRTPGFNLFKASNNGLLALAGLPPFPDRARRIVRPRHTARAATTLRAHSRVPARRRRRGSRAQQAVGGY